MTSRRGFLGAILAAAVAPAIAKSGVLMPVRQIITPPLVLWGDGIHDDTAALQAAINGQPVRFADGRPLTGLIAGGTYRLTRTIVWGESISPLTIADAGLRSSASPVIELMPTSRGLIRSCLVEGNGRPDSVGVMYRLPAEAQHAH